MSLKPTPIGPVPEHTARVARAAFPKGNPYLRLRDELGTIFRDDDFADLYPRRGQPALAALAAGPGHRPAVPRGPLRPPGRRRRPRPHRLEVPARPGADRPGLRLLRALRVPLPAARRRGRGAAAGEAAGALPGAGPAQGPGPAADRRDPRAGRGPRDEPAGAAGRDPARGPERAGRRGPGVAARRGPGGVVRALRPPHRGQPPAAEPRRTARRTREPVGEDGFTLLDRLDGPEAPAELRALPMVEVLRRVWERHFGATAARPAAGRGPGPPEAEGELPPAAEGIESPYDPEARYRSKRGTHWTGYVAHLTETCDEDRPAPDHARGDDHRRGARGELHRGDPAGAGRAGAAAGRAPGRRRLS